MSTDTSQMGVSLEPDWLRSKPVFSRNRYGQEELLNLWTTLPACPQTILDIPELGSDEPLKPAYLAQYTEEQDFRTASGRGGRVSDRGSRGGRGGGSTSRGGRGPYNSKFGSSSSSSDNWRRRDPEPSTDDLEMPNYPVYSGKGYSPTDIDDRETNSWKRTVTEEHRGDTSPLSTSLPPQLGASPLVSQPSSVPMSLSKSMVEDSPEAMLRSISKSVYDEGDSFDRKFGTPFSDSLNEGGNLFTSAVSMPSQISSSGVGDSLFGGRPEPNASGHFPSLAEIGTSLSMERGSILRGPGFLQQQQQQQQATSIPFSQSPPTSTSPVVVTKPELWFYLDPKSNTQGPFDSKKMFSWFVEGYFGMDLFIRRSSEEKFTKLEVLIKECGGKIPFQTEEKSPSPPRPTAVPPTTAAPSEWTAITSSIWGGGDATPANPFMTSPFLDEKAKRAEEMRQEIERAMAQKRKIEEDHLKENQTESFLLAQRQMMEAKLAEDHKVEEELSRIREEEANQKSFMEAEALRIRLEKEQLEHERQRQAENARKELEEAERARQELAQERLNLERERQLVKQKEEELFKRQELERKNLAEVRLAEERAAAQKAAEEAKALARAQEDAAKAAREAERKAAQERKPTSPTWTSPPQRAWGATDNTHNTPPPPAQPASGGWAAKAQWGSPPQQENTNPWANIPKNNTTRSTAPTTRAAAGSRGWSKPGSTAATGAVPLSQIQQDEVKRKANAPVKSEAPSSNRGPMKWGAAPKVSTARSLADIQKEEQKRSTQQQNYNYVQQNSWNPVAGMLDEDLSPQAPLLSQLQTKPKAQPKPKPQAKAQPKPQPKAQAKKQPTKSVSPPPAPVMENVSEPKDPFSKWCEDQIAGFKNPHIDVPTFISFLRSVDSPRDVREYVVSYLGDTMATDKFIQEFVARRKSSGQRESNGATITMTMGSGKNKTAQQPQAQGSSKKGKKKKMQKVNAAHLLGINCTASSDARNRGDIDYVVG